MKAIRVTDFGGPDLLKLQDVPDPKPDSGQVLIRVKATEASGRAMPAILHPFRRVCSKAESAVHAWDGRGRHRRSRGIGCETLQDGRSCLHQWHDHWRIRGLGAVRTIAYASSSSESFFCARSSVGSALRDGVSCAVPNGTRKGR